VARRVVDPHGVTWTIRRRWLHAPVRPRWRGPDDGASVLDLAFGLDDLGPITWVIGIVVLAGLLAFVVLPLAVLLLEVLVFLLLAAAGVLAACCCDARGGSRHAATTTASGPGRSRAGVTAARRSRRSRPRWSPAGGSTFRPVARRGFRRLRGLQRA
jgi:hypothetical protein